MKSRAGLIFLGLALVVVALAAGVVALNVRDEDRIPPDARPAEGSPQQIERGAYLARAGNCIGCHTARGGPEYGGGRGIATPFGTVYSPNLTPDEKTGIGTWSSAHFWRAMHNGRSRDGRLLYPAFPYPNYTQVTREDSDAIYAFLRSLPPADRPNLANELRFPYDSQISLAVWRALFFAPGVYQPDPAQSAQWNRGNYLVHGLGHCNACHAGRNIFGATSDNLELSGGLIPMQNWYAPSLSSPQEAGVADWDVAEVVSLLKKGLSRHGSAMGPMGEVVFRSTQYLSEPDLQGMAVFLKALPQAPAPAQEWPRRHDPNLLPTGRKLYEQHCAGCHGLNGEGAVGAYPALERNRAVLMATPANLIRVVLNGGYLPATATNPRPYGMPPFGHVLNDAEIAAVVTYIRQAWTNDAAPVSSSQVVQFR